MGTTENEPQVLSLGLLSLSMKRMNKIKTQNTDEELVVKAIGDIVFFEQLIERYEGRLTRYILRLSNISHEEAEDILQEVFVKAWRNLYGYDSKCKFSTWIYSIARNESISQFRKRKSRIGDMQQVNNEIFTEIPDKFDLAEHIDKKLRAKTVKKTINKLPIKYKEILILKYYEDLSYDEISDILKKPSGTVATLLNRAKKAFKNELTNE